MGDLSRADKQSKLYMLGGEAPRLENELCRYKAALREICERFESKQALHKEDCFAYQVASAALAGT